LEVIWEFCVNLFLFLGYCKNPDLMKFFIVNFSTIDVQGVYNTQAHGINNTGQIVGSYDDASGGHGFLATPTPEPSTMLLLGSELIGLVGYGRRRFLKKVNLSIIEEGKGRVI